MRAVALWGLLLAVAGCSSGDGTGASSGLRRSPDSVLDTSTTAPSLPVATDAGPVTGVDPCALVPAAEAAELLGPLADAPAPQSREGRRVACTYTPSAGPTLSLTVDPLSFFERAAMILADAATVRDDSIVVDGDRYVAVWFRTATVVVGVNGPPGSLGEALALAERAERNLPA